MIILARQDGILRLASESEIKETWQYRMIDKTESYCLIDYDAEKAQPIVKSILNDLDLFPELKILKQIRIFVVVLSILSIFLSSFILIFKPSKEFITEKLEANKQTTAQKKASTEALEMKSIINQIWQIEAPAQKK